MTRGDRPALAAPGWKVHAVLLGIGAFLALPILALDLMFLGPTGSGWIDLDFRGFAIGGYLVLWLSESLLATIVVAIGRGRSVGLTIVAHVLASIAVVLVLAGLWVADEVSSEARYRDHIADVARQREVARTELRVVSWGPVAGSDPPRVRVTVESTVPGEVTIEAVESPSVPARGYQSDLVELAAGSPSVVEIESYSDREPGPAGRDRIRLRWTASARAYPIYLEACRPLCVPGSEMYDEAATDLPPISMP